MLLLNHILRKCTCGNILQKSLEKIHHVMYMDDIKLFAKNEKQLETLIQAVMIYSDGKGIEYDIEKCVILIMNSGKKK